MNFDETRLSSEGMRRKQAMLDTLVRDMQHFHRRRRRQRRVAWSVTPLLAIAVSIGVWQMGARAMQDQMSRVVATNFDRGAGQSITTREPRRVDIQIVQTNPSILEKHRARSPSQAVVLDDAMLLEALARLNRPTGLIRTQGRAWLTEEVTDAGLEPERGL